MPYYLHMGNYGEQLDDPELLLEHPTIESAQAEFESQSLYKYALILELDKRPVRYDAFEPTGLRMAYTETGWHSFPPFPDTWEDIWK